MKHNTRQRKTAHTQSPLMYINNNLIDVSSDYFTINFQYMARFFLTLKSIVYFRLIFLSNGHFIFGMAFSAENFDLNSVLMCIAHIF